jgi:hypothetical protein
MPAPAPSPQIADALARSLAPVFVSLCTERYGGSVSLRRVERDASPSAVHFRLDHPRLPVLEASFTIHHVGGNVYDVEGRVEGGPVRSFCYCLPDPAPLLVPEAPRLARDVAAFLLDALERRLGSDLLRRAVQSDERTASPVPPSSALRTVR